MEAPTQKVVKVLRIVRQGISKKNGKPYEIVLVLSDGGDEIEVFGPAKIGDGIADITFNQQYDKTQGKIVKPDRQEAIMDMLQIILGIVQELQQKYLTQASGSERQQDAHPSSSSRPPSIPRQVPPSPRAATGPSRMEDRLKQWQVPRVEGTKIHDEPAPSDEDMPIDFLTDDESEIPDDL